MIAGCPDTAQTVDHQVKEVLNIIVEKARFRHNGDDDNKTFQNALAQKYKMMSAGGYKGKHPDKVESFQTSYPLGDVKTYEPRPKHNNVVWL